MSAIEELILAHARGCREAIAVATSRVEALEELAAKLKNWVPPKLPNRFRGEWTEAENEVMREHYATLGPARLVALLPHRTRMAIAQQGHHLELHYMPSRKKVYCDQCDANVLIDQVATCKSKFCTAKAVVAAGGSQ